MMTMEHDTYADIDADREAEQRKARRRALRQRLARAIELGDRLREIDSQREIAANEHAAETARIQERLNDLETPDEERAKLLDELQAANKKLEVAIDKCKRLGQPLREAIQHENLVPDVIRNEIVRAGDPSDLAAIFANNQLATYIGRLDEPFELLGKFRSALASIEDNPRYAREHELYADKIRRFEALCGLLDGIKSDAHRKAEEIRRRILTEK